MTVMMMMIIIITITIAAVVVVAFQPTTSTSDCLSASVSEYLLSRRSSFLSFCSSSLFRLRVTWYRSRPLWFMLQCVLESARLGERGVSGFLWVSGSIVSRAGCDGWYTWGNVLTVLDLFGLVWFGLFILFSLLSSPIPFFPLFILFSYSFHSSSYSLLFVSSSLFTLLFFSFFPSLFSSSLP